MATAVDEGQIAATFLREVGAPDTPEMRKAVIAWLRKESGSNVIGNNPWNISLSAAKGIGVPICGERTHSRTGQKFAIYCNITDGTKAAAKLLESGTTNPRDTRGYGGVIQAAKMSDPIKFLDALARSKWSADRYGGPGATNSLIQVYQSVGGTVRTLADNAGIDLLKSIGISTDAGHIITEAEARKIATDLYKINSGKAYDKLVSEWTGKRVSDFAQASIESGAKFEGSPFDTILGIAGSLTDPGFWARVLALLAGIALVGFGTIRLTTA